MIVEGRLVEARWTGAAGGWRSLKAWFVVEDTFKGGVAKGSRLLVSRSCHDQPIPKDQLGYPSVDNYCPGGYGLDITGVKPGGVAPDSRSETWILYLEKTLDPGILKEIQRHSYVSRCGAERKDLGPRDQKAYDRLTTRAQELTRPRPR